MKKRQILAPLSLSLLLLGACNADTDNEKEVDKEQTEPTENVVKEPVDKSDTTASNDELKEEFEKEEGVSEVSLIITEDAGGFVLLDFEVTEDMKKEDAEKISKKYYERLEKEYPEHSIDIQARKSGETFVQETKEVK
ncbi:hypothetical protein CSV80_05220 [Sporosarcina sp. P12(2017)]|uniref:Cation efflux protein cytoplasmic domain-containing protein n=1 Tax=Sporosarcina ureae TaxID=1571 RepID=A0ABM6JXW8_SPOUR|nr:MULTISPECIES: hypothetical protein [Sporosarcina]ARF15011.1 hypothetical protein SporoS204_13145 [Sporosarcina ureae]PIC58408.1 hypothetical protein CSV81_04510 [Sporosarcina sp. P10]PIC61427.1 hypothetical protein CSV80_05220 [Sporosarcina sp. P12(2017)]